MPNELKCKFHRDYLGYRGGQVHVVPGGLAASLIQRNICEVVSTPAPKPARKSRSAKVKKDSGNA